MNDYLDLARRSVEDAMSTHSDEKGRYIVATDSHALNRAQVIATMALAEEQRTANLIAALRIFRTDPATRGTVAGLREQISNRLGLGH